MTVTDLSEKTLGCAEVIDIAPNGSWVTIELSEYTRSGYVRKATRFRVSVFDAATIARRVHEAVRRQAHHVNRLSAIARGEGY